MCFFAINFGENKVAFDKNFNSEKVAFYNSASEIFAELMRYAYSSEVASRAPIVRHAAISIRCSNGIRINRVLASTNSGKKIL